MASGGSDVAYYTLPVILSFEGSEKAINNSIGKSLSVAGTKGGKDFGQSFTKVAEADIKKLGTQYSRMYDKAADAADKLKVAQAGVEDLVSKGITSGKRYEAAIASRNKATRDEARQVRETADAYKDLESAQSGVGGSSAGSEAAAGFMDGFGGPIAALGSKAGPIGAALVAAAGLGVVAGGLLAKQVMAGLEQEAASDKIQARFGLDEATMQKFGDAGGKAYAANFGDSISGNIEAAAVALQNGLLPKDAGADQTKAVVEQLSTVATVLGVDIPEAARSAGQLMRTGFASDFNEAADLIVAGAQSGLNVSEDWLDTVNEYSTQFRKLGVSGPEALGLLSQAVKAGARDTDVAADALKEFTIRSIDGSKSTMGAFHTLGLDFERTTDTFAKGGPAAHDMFQQVLQGIQQIQDPYTKANVQVALFGTQSEDLGAALNSFDLSHATEQLGEVGGAAQTASDILGGNTASSVESAKRTIELASTTMQKSLADAFGPTLQKGVDWVIAHQDDIVQFFELGANAAVKFVGAMTGMAGDMVVVFGNVQAAVGDAVGFILDGFEVTTGAAAKLASAFGNQGLAAQLQLASAQIGKVSDTFHESGETTIAAGHALSGFGTDLQHVTDGLGTTDKNARNAAAQIEGVKASLANLPGGKTIDINAIVTYKDTAGQVISPDQLRISQRQQSAAAGNEGHRAQGGAIKGPGGPTSDIIPIWASNDEHMLPADEVQMLGGQEGVYRMRGLIRGGMLGKFAGGGAIGGPDVEAAMNLAGTGYSQSNRTDCSGMVARVIARALGLPESGLMSTKNAESWLAERGFQPGRGGPGQISVGWYDHGPGPNDGHMAMTLSDGENAEAGGSHGTFLVGSGAKGADDPQFDQHMFLPQLFGEGAGGSSSLSMGSGSGVTDGGGTPGIGPNGESGTYSAPDAKAVREADQKVSDADFKVKQAELKLRELDADAKESQKQAALKDVEDAKREAADARTDAATTKQGKFTAGGKGAAGKSGGPQLSELGGIAKSFLTETFGLDGSWLPDIGNLAPLQMADTLLSALVPQFSGAGTGGGAPGAQTSSGAFGMPEIPAPGMPEGANHLGPNAGGLPGPTIINNDLSANFAGNVGQSWDEIQKQQERTQQRGLARISGIPLAVGS